LVLVRFGMCPPLGMCRLCGGGGCLVLLVCRCMRALSLICVDASRLAVGREVPPEGVRLAPLGIGYSYRV
jgi:hypothetical protein